MRVTLADGTAPYLDLPGGAIDPGETAAEAVVREFGEETGLSVTAGAVFARAGQFFVTSRGEAVNNRCVFHLVQKSAGDVEKVEDDHELVWLESHAALARLRHDAHAWAVAAWLRSGLSTVRQPLLG